MAVPVNLLDDDDDEAPTAMAPLAGAGFVQGGNAMYTVMDDLKVVPMSTISAITLLNTLGVLNIGMVEQKTVQAWVR
jgi:hydroxymethylpyrimidine/phosphomethylpyrimidine kinase